jgi:putative toxin-antitoxin system antitoxin component (TIGR02293 family)
MSQIKEKKTRRKSNEFLSDKPSERIALIRRGIPKKLLIEFQRNSGLSNKIIATILHVSERTLQRRSSDELLNPDASEKLLQLSSLYNHGINVFGSVEKFSKWINRPSPRLENNKPIELFDTFDGISQVEHELGRIEYGIFA